MGNARGRMEGDMLVSHPLVRICRHFQKESMNHHRKLILFTLSGLLVSCMGQACQGQSGSEQESPINSRFEKIEVMATPTQPYLLPDQKTKILVKKETLYSDRVRSGIPQLTYKDLTLDIVPNTVIASGGYLFHFTEPFEYEFGHHRESDMIFTVVDSFKCSVLREKSTAPQLQLKKLSGNLKFEAKHASGTRQLKGIHGKGRHFVALRVTGAEIYRKHPSKVLGTGMDIFVVNNFGSKKIRLEYMKKEIVKIGPETITIESFNFQYETKSVEIKVSTEPSVAAAAALIVEYGKRQVDAEPAAQAKGAIDVTLLAGAWTNSREEEKEFRGRVFRPTDSMQFPFSRFRKKYIFNKDGSGMLLYLHPADRHQMVACQWKVTEEGRITITAMFGDKVIKESFEVLELTKDILRVK